jgi:hypothetical protein
MRSFTDGTFTTQFKTNEGYLNVALRVFVFAGFLSHQINNETEEIKFGLTEKKRICLFHYFIYMKMWC